MVSSFAAGPSMITFTMAKLNVAFTVIILMNIHYVWAEDSDFTKIGKIHKSVVPFKLNDKMYFITNAFAKHASIFTTDPADGECHLDNLDVSRSWVWVLGNGKLLINDKYITHFNVIDLKKCSHQSVTFISNYEDEKNRYLQVGYESKIPLVTYNNTFDVFDQRQEYCTPCRFNDKGERLYVEYSLGEDLRNKTNDGFSLDRIDDAFGVMNGYFYVLRYRNDTTALRILDSKFRLVKQLLFPAKIQAHSSTHKSLTVCYKVYASQKKDCGFERVDCAYVQCHLLDSNFKITAKVKLHRSITDPGSLLYVQMRVQNLVGGGAMVAMKFHFNRPEPVHQKDVFIQRIHPNGRVDPPILFDSLYKNFVAMYDFVFDNGEYCLVTINDYYEEEAYTLVKCLDPTPADYSSDEFEMSAY